MKAPAIGARRRKHLPHPAAWPAMPHRLHFLPISHYNVKARRILDYKRIPYEIVPAPYHDRQHLLQVSGQDYSPYLELERPEGGRRGVEWHEIPDWAERAQPQPTLYPDGSRPLARLVESWAHNQLEEAVWRWVLPDAELAFADPRERWVFVEMQMRKRGDPETWEMMRPAALKNLQSHLQLVEDALERQPWLLGGKPGLADFAAFGALSPIETTRNQIPDGYKRVADWYARVKAL